MKIAEGSALCQKRTRTFFCYLIDTCQPITWPLSSRSCAALWDGAAPSGVCAKRLQARACAIGAIRRRKEHPIDIALEECPFSPVTHVCLPNPTQASLSLSSFGANTLAPLLPPHFGASFCGASLSRDAARTCRGRPVPSLLPPAPPAPR
eukprot:6213336-Pleurochrysis_carterae.AAC.2